MRTIRVTGKGILKLKPDTTRLSITLEGKSRDYAKVLMMSAEDTETLRGVLTGLGFEKSDLKTLSFNVDTEYEGYDDHGNWRQRFVGYRYNHSMKLEFGSDNDRLGKVLYALANCPVDPQFRISYTVRDPEAAKGELLAKAVEDARSKAAVLTEAAGVALKGIELIDYSWGEIDFEVPAVNRMPLMAKGAAFTEESMDMALEPDDIRVEDTVTVVWEIE